MMPLGDLKVALVHDELTRRGGAEIVLEELLRIFPQVDVYALYAGNPYFTFENRRYDIHTSFLQKFPVWWRRHPKRLLPLLPYAAEQLDLSDYQLVISSASAFAKGIVTRANIPHICYCHTPTRYLWERVDQPWWAQAAFHYLRLVDQAAAQRVDFFLANSHYTHDRINTYYRRDSQVVYPPIKTNFFTPDRKVLRRHYLAVGRLTPNKNFDQAIIACEKLHQPLVIVGVGAEKARLQKLAGKYTQFANRVSEAELRQLYRSAYALLQPGIEDFGMATAEAQACGTPVIAFNAGGVREVVRDGETGLLYQHQQVESLAEAMRQFSQNRQRYTPEASQHQALRFTPEAFERGILSAVNQVTSL